MCMVTAKLLAQCGYINITSINMITPFGNGIQSQNITCMMGFQVRG